MFCCCWWACYSVIDFSFFPSFLQVSADHLSSAVHLPQEAVMAVMTWSFGCRVAPVCLMCLFRVTGPVLVRCSKSLKQILGKKDPCTNIQKCTQLRRVSLMLPGAWKNNLLPGDCIAGEEKYSADLVESLSASAVHGPNNGILAVVPIHNTAQSQRCQIWSECS